MPLIRYRGFAKNIYEMFPRMKTLLKVYMEVLTYHSALKGERRKVNMHKKKPLCLGFVVLLLSMATVIMPVSGGVEPSRQQNSLIFL